MQNATKIYQGKALSTPRSTWNSKVVIAVQSRGFGSQTEGPLKKTALHSLHVELGAKMVPFCGWDMPVQYKESIIDSHLHTRTKAGLFDVSHMAQLRITGKDRVKFLESLTVADLETLPEGSAKLSVLTNEKGGIIDDTMITNRGSHIYMVVNAGCADKDIPHLKKHVAAFQAKGLDVSLEHLSRSLLALQGPQAEKVLLDLVKYDLSKMPFMTAQEMYVAGTKCLVSRCGYTGEDGFEISVSHEDAVGLAKLFLSKSAVIPVGLGARDTLRLESGLCLYGNDLEEHITPVEASLTWLIGKRRKEEGGFLGAEKILGQLKNPESVTKKRVGLFVTGPPAREHTPIYHPPGSESNNVGEATSGTLSPVLKKAISMAYVSTPLSKVGTELSVKVRGKLHPAVVTKMPFVPTNYKKL